MALYIFRDRVSGKYSVPVCIDANDAALRRSLKKALETPTPQAQPWQVFPQDHELYCCGEFDPDTGRLTAFDNPEFLFNISDLLEV